jgi:hypothetical protein
MTNAATSFAEIKKEITDKRSQLEKIHTARQQVPGQTSRPAPRPVAVAAASVEGAPSSRTFRLLAQGDSWFDYPPGTDIVDCLHTNHGHTIGNIAVAGSTLNDEAYGPVPHELFGLPLGPAQSDDPSRIAELVHRICEDKPQGLLLSAGGNDVAGDPFFSFINNAESGLAPVNQQVLTGVVGTTFDAALRFILDNGLAAAADNGLNMPIFVHGYDYPWPDGRGLIQFLGWKVGPWFDPVFNEKNFPNQSPAQLQIRRNVLVVFIDTLNTMLQKIAADSKYAGKVFYIDLRNTIPNQEDWANELHPGNDGFAWLAAKVDASLQAHMP